MDEKSIFPNPFLHQLSLCLTLKFPQVVLFQFLLFFVCLHYNSVFSLLMTNITQILIILLNYSVFFLV